MTAASLVASGCPTGDPNDDGSADDGGGGQDDAGFGVDLPGRRVECCYTLTEQDTLESAVGCTYPAVSPCIDPADPSLDTNGDGTLDEKELTLNVCAPKCPQHPDDFPFFGPSFYEYGTPGQALSTTPPYIGCRAVIGTLPPDSVTCDPSFPGQDQPWQSVSEPSHGANLASSSAPDQAPLVEVLGHAVPVNFAGSIGFELGRCVPIAGARRAEQCDVTISGLDIVSTQPEVFGAYRLDYAHVGLATPFSTSAVFTCSATGCASSFDLARTSQRGIELDLDWGQTTIATNSVGGGTLRVSNAPDSLVRVPILDVELRLDAAKGAGTIRITGSVADALDGTFVRSSFDVRGSVEATATR